MSGETEAVHEHADGADDAGLVGVYFVGGGDGVIAARGTDVADHRVQRNLGILLAQPQDFVVDVAGLHRAAAGAVGAQHDTDGVLGLERRAQAGDDVIRARLPVRGDGAVNSTSAV